jgi:catechol 2,3-dioxygenase-like lactoylglutathione lyase family enzyme
MKRLLSVLSLAVLLPQSPSWAQLYPPNEAGVTMGAWHLIVRDLDAASKFWILVGAKPIKIDGTDVMKLPGVFIFLTPGSPSGPSVGSSVDHIGIKISTGKAFPDRLKAAKVKMDPTDPVTGRTAGYKPGKNRSWGFAYPSDDLKLEILDDVMVGGDAPLKIFGLADPDTNRKDLPPVECDHVHMYVPDKASITAAQAWYGKLFGAQAFADTGAGALFCPESRDAQRKGECSRLRLQSVDGKPAPSPSKGRAVDYIGFEVKNLEAFCKKLDANGVKFDQPYSKTRHKGFASAMLTDPWGTSIELTEGLNRF